MGDVAMLLPILYGVAKANPEHEFVLLTQPFFTKLLISAPSNLRAKSIDIKTECKGLGGLLRYVRGLIRERYDLYLDLHNVLRTQVIRTGLRLWGCRTLHLSKPRSARKRLLASVGKGELSPLPSMYSLYQEVFRQAGLRVPTIEERSIFAPSDKSLREKLPELFDGRELIGISPFASTDSKTYDLSQMEAVISTLTSEGKTVCLFGGRGSEAETLEGWAERYPLTYSLAGKLSLEEELSMMSQLKLMLSMDSANMHLASLVACPVISIWCATHPSAGFLGIGQKRGDCLTNEHLGCSPCSIFGKVDKCKRGDMPCRRSISTEQIVAKINSYTVGYRLL